jgi:hypothetical protein
LQAFRGSVPFPSPKGGDSQTACRHGRFIGSWGTPASHSRIPKRWPAES